jgi:light-regulated signal transduction histidine kinase (bacteriophytochrome)
VTESHTPSAIQPHGTLLVVELASDRIVQVGLGTEAVLHSSRPILNRQLADVMGVPAAVVGSAAFSSEPVYVSSLIPERETCADIDITAHRSNGLLIIEIEGTNAPRLSAPHMLGRVRSISAALQTASDLPDTCRVAARELRD